MSHGVKNAAYFCSIKHKSLWEDYLVVSPVAAPEIFFVGAWHWVGKMLQLGGNAPYAPHATTGCAPCFLLVSLDLQFTVQYWPHLILLHYTADFQVHSRI